MGRTRAEAQRGNGEGGNAASSDLFSAKALVCRKGISEESPPKKKGRGQRMKPTHPDSQLENDTAPSAPSAGNSPDGYVEGRLGKRIPFRTGSGGFKKLPTAYVLNQ